MISKCCKATVVSNYGDEGTNHYRCVSCGEACDVLPYHSRSEMRRIQVQKECTNHEDHLCKKCEGLPHGRAFKGVTPELMESAKKAAESFREERGEVKPSEIIKEKLLAKTSSFDRHPIQSDLELLVESMVEYLDELHQENQWLKKRMEHLEDSMFKLMQDTL